MSGDYPTNAFGHGSQVPAEIFFGATALLVLAYCVKVARAQRSPWPVFVWIGAAPAMVYEAINNNLAHCIYALEGQHTLITLMGRELPVMTLVLYLTYFPLGITFLMQRFERGITQRQLWRYYVIAVVIAAAFEPLFCNKDIGLTWWYYYGDQVLDFTGLPMWWWFVNPLCWFGPAAIFHLVRKHALRGDERATWIFIPGVFLATFATHGSASVPMWLAISSDAGTTVQILCTALSASIAIGYIWLVGRFVCVEQTQEVAAGAGDRVPSRPPRVALPG